MKNVDKKENQPPQTSLELWAPVIAVFYFILVVFVLFVYRMTVSLHMPDSTLGLTLFGASVILVPALMLVGWFMGIKYINRLQFNVKKAP